MERVLFPPFSDNGHAFDAMLVEALGRFPGCPTQGRTCAVIDGAMDTIPSPGQSDLTEVPSQIRESVNAILGGKRCERRSPHIVAQYT